MVAIFSLNISNFFVYFWWFGILFVISQSQLFFHRYEARDYEESLDGHGTADECCGSDGYIGCGTETAAEPRVDVRGKRQ
jgi:hypothetical protein